MLQLDTEGLIETVRIDADNNGLYEQQVQKTDADVDGRYEQTVQADDADEDGRFERITTWQGGWTPGQARGDGFRGRPPQG